METKFRFGY